MTELAERLASLKVQHGKDIDAFHKARVALDTTTALIMQGLMIELADEEPKIESFRLDANYEYDDEGSYYWSGSFYAEGPELDEVDESIEPWERTESLREWGDEQATALAFESTDTFQATITVARLRELWAIA